MNRKIWDEQTNEAVLNYITSTNAGERNRTYERYIFPKITIIVDIVLKKSGIKTTDENKQDLFIKSLSILEHIKPDNVKTSQEYIYRGLTNCAIDMHKRTKTIEYIENYNEDTSITIDEYTFECDELRKQIICAIDSKINQFDIINRSNVVFLLLLKQYLIDNNFDQRGFDVYIMETMSISINQFRNISCSLNIKTKVLREKLINE